VDNSNDVSRMNKTSSSKRANKMEHPIIENDGNNGTVVHTCNECGKSFKEINSPNRHKGIH
jgi:rubrerythrin